jgi:hypothetical protein
MVRYCLRFCTVATLISITFTASGSFSSSLNTIENQTSAAAATSICPSVDPFTLAIDRARIASTLAQSARTKQEWDLLILRWMQAITAMQSVPLESPKHTFAQKKVTEYLQNLDIARQKSAKFTSQLPFGSFDNQIFNDQLLLYLSYISAFGPPDILIVGSSRALIGIDPQQLQQALSNSGKKNLTVFNFGINGGTSQIVDFQLRQLLTRTQLPRLIIWADGVRAFNSGRVDRTYNSLVASAGYKRLIAGNRPQLPVEVQPQTIPNCENFSPSVLKNTKKSKPTASLDSTSSTANYNNLQLTTVSFNTLNNPNNQLILAQRTPGERNLTDYSSSAIDSLGFLPLENRFDSNLYYQKNPRVSGQYDSDYQPFSLTGQQAIAFNSIKAFTKQQKIPLIFVNLPLTQDYLDSIRQSREQQFTQWMKQQVTDGFIVIDLGQQWLNQNQYFVDPSHLNRFGAAAISNQLATNSQIPWPQPRR